MFWTYTLLAAVVGICPAIFALLTKFERFWDMFMASGITGMLSVMGMFFYFQNPYIGYAVFALDFLIWFWLNIIVWADWE